MAAIRSTGNRATELKLATIFRVHGVTGWRRHQALPGKPDFVFRRERLVVFVDGCFWHGCPIHGRNPGSNRAYWLPKLHRNRQRDRVITRDLSKSGWTVLRFWEHDLVHPHRAVRRIVKLLERYPANRLQSRSN